MNSRMLMHPIGIMSDAIKPQSQNYKLPCWPPHDDFPVVIAADGTVVSRMGDSRWKFWPWCNQTLSLSFGDTAYRGNPAVISKENAWILRLITLWILYAQPRVISVKSLISQVTRIRPVFTIASREGISVTDLSRYPKVLEAIANEMPYQSLISTIALLHSLLAEQDTLGFCILNTPQLRALAKMAPPAPDNQTAYIPPRIWNYQIQRLNEFIEDFLSHKESVTACFEYCLDAYIKLEGSLELACTTGKRGQRRVTPFNEQKGGTAGRFYNVARDYDLVDLLEKWVVPEGEKLSDRRRGVVALSQYFSMTNLVGLASILNYSLMRMNEAWNLKSDCLVVEDDPDIGKIFMLRGTTTKTIDDDDAYWITTPAVARAVEAVNCVRALRSKCEKANLKIKPNPAGNHIDWLFVRPSEPWANTTAHVQGVRHICPSYLSSLESYPKLFDLGSLITTKRDIEVALAITPNLNVKKILLEKPWPLAWHQLRRTGAVNMRASGVVSDATIQYQLKHASRVMSLYYGRGYSAARLNSSAREEFIKTMYEILAHEISTLFDDRFISPHGAQRKLDILNLVDSRDLKQIATIAKSGKISWRATVLGGCTKKGFCEYGGIDNITRCGGGDGRPPCIDAIFDQSRRSRIVEYGKIIEERLVSAEEFSPLQESLNSQLRAVENALRVIDAHEDKAT
ncbi:hypothetical protein N7592_11240 [Pseudomonas juntendi]|uniref:hypothetical protein n=1 Tax=Pseudomonas juntendi TaxID=2666183 RepID=UPI00244D787A|nr:hypothetical protein [Pseudomonas juntendi]MDG9873770.1 hypothetical protein [Pseudomonas juntendi]